MLLGERQGGADVEVGNVMHMQAVTMAGKHLATAEQLDLIVLRPGVVDARMADEHFKGFIGVLAVQWLASADTSRKHEVTHAADMP